MSNQSWVFCPICNNKTRTKIRNDTELINFPLFCLNITVRQSRQSGVARATCPD